MKTQLLTITTILLLGQVALGAPGPKAVIHDGSEQVRAILKVKVKKNSPAEEAQKAKLKKVVDGFLDYTELSRRALGPHWKDRSETERTEFVGLLRDLIEASYTNGIRKNVDYTLNLEDEEVAADGARADVTAVAGAKNKKGKLVSEDLIFHLYLKNRIWMIFDVEFGDVSLVRHYQGEFNRKIKKEGYAALVTVMKKKLEEVRAGKTEREIKL